MAIANGEKLSSAGHYKGVSMRLQGVPIKVDIYLLLLEACDVVLGAQWLSTLGPIIWDFSTLHMTFKVDGKEVSLKGIKEPYDKLVDDIKFTRKMEKI